MLKIKSIEYINELNVISLKIIDMVIQSHWQSVQPALIHILINVKTRTKYVI